MTTPTPSPRFVTMLAPLGDGFVEYAARLAPFDALTPGQEPHPSSWFVTHGLGTPAGGTYTEVVIEPNLDGSPTAAVPLPEHVLDAVVRQVAVALYGTAWAFHYRPDQYDDAIARHRLIRRERVVVEGIEVQ